MMFEWVKGFIVGTLLGIIALEGGIIAVQYAIIGGFNDGLKNAHRKKYRSYY